MTRLETVIHSVQFRQFAEQNGVTPAELHSLRRLVIHATSLTIPAQATVRPPDQNDVAQQLACEFFTWLRGVVLSACAKLPQPLDKPEEFPVRVTVPAFASEAQLAQQPGCVRLATALRRANWKLHTERPFVSEPYANAIGALTQGSNCTRVGDMFQQGLLITALRASATYPTYQVVVIDIGAYTTDFAVLTLRTDGRIIELSEIEFESKTVSVPVGMSDLDEAVVAALSPENQQYMRDEASTADWMRLRRDVYMLKKSFFSPVGEIGGSAERPQIDQAFDGFQSRLATEVETFFQSLDDISFKELILTGGGCAFPGIQETLINTAERGRAAFRKVHLPIVRGTGQRSTTPQQVITLLEGYLPRGGTALGGTSAYFDMLS